MAAPHDLTQPAPPGEPALDPRDEETLDPSDWEAFRALAHRMVDDALDYQRTLRERPAWQPMPDAVKAALRAPLPRRGQGEAAAYADFVEQVLPYPYGNIHPRAWGWVNGQGTPLGVMAEMLAATLNPNTWGGEHGAAWVEAQVLDWLRDIVGFPGDSGVLVSGGSVANLVALAAARDAADRDVATRGVRALDAPLAVYASVEAHNSVDKAVALLGLGLDALRRIPVDADYRMDTDALAAALAADRARGIIPACVVATAGTVNTGAIDPLDAIADLCARERVWLHVDGAFGALAAASPALAPLLRGLERADSLAFDPHKWLYMPIEIGCVLVRDAGAHRRPFTAHAGYLERLDDGPAAGPHAFASLGPQLTRGFRALKAWLSIKAYGADAYGRLIEQNVRQARHLAALARAHPRLELAAPVPLNVVCFRYVRPDLGDTALDDLNRDLLVRLQVSGEAIPSSTRLHGRFVLRCAFTNHRTRREDVEHLVDAVVRLGDAA